MNVSIDYTFQIYIDYVVKYRQIITEIAENLKKN